MTDLPKLKLYVPNTPMDSPKKPNGNELHNNLLGANLKGSDNDNSESLDYSPCAIASPVDVSQYPSQALVLEDEPICNMTTFAEFVEKQVRMLHDNIKFAPLDTFTDINFEEQEARCSNTIKKYFETVKNLKRKKVADEKQRLYEEYYQRIKRLKDESQNCCSPNCMKSLMFDDHKRLDCNHNLCFNCCLVRITVKESESAGLFISCPQCNSETCTQTRY